MIEAFIERFGKVNLNSTNEGESDDGGNAVMVRLSLHNTENMAWTII